jgi:hypothetical protein
VQDFVQAELLLVDHGSVKTQLAASQQLTVVIVCTCRDEVRDFVQAELLLDLLVLGQAGLTTGSLFWCGDKAQTIARGACPLCLVPPVWAYHGRPQARVWQQNFMLCLQFDSRVACWLCCLRAAHAAVEKAPLQKLGCV